MEILITIFLLFIAALLGVITRRRNVIEGFTVIASCIVIICSFTIAFNVANNGQYQPYPFFYVDSLGAILIMIIGVIGLATTIYSIPYLRKETEKGIIGLTRVRQYYTLLNAFILMMYLAITSSSPIFFWIFLEATTLSTVFLISFYNKLTAVEAAWKYLIINSIALLLGFLGTLLFLSGAGQSESNGIVTWQFLIENATKLDPGIAKIALIFVLIGYGTKVGLAPMHTWLPDAHSKAPAPISALLSGVLLNIAFVAILRFKAITDIVTGSDYSQNILIVFGLLSIFISTFIIFSQKNYKRLLAYSSIENMGIISIGFALGGLGTLAGVLHIIFHSLIKSSLFMSVGTIFLRYSSTKIVNIQGVLKVLPITGITLIFGFLVITGTPPFGIFFSKLLLLSVGIEKIPIITVSIVLAMAIVFVGFMKHMSGMVFDEKPRNVETGNENIWLVIPPVVLLCIAFILVFYCPPYLYTLINSVVLNY